MKESSSSTDNLTGLSFSELSRAFQINEDALRSRYYRGDRGEHLIRPARKEKSRPMVRTIIDGEEYSFKELAEQYDIKYSTIQFRYRQGLRGKDLLYSKNDYVTINGHIYTIDQLARQYQISRTLIHERQVRGKHGKALITPPLPEPIQVDWQGQKYSLYELAQRYGLSYNLIYQRYHRGQRGDALVRPKY